MKILTLFAIVCHCPDCCETFATHTSKKTLLAVWNHSATRLKWHAAPSGKTYCDTHWHPTLEPHDTPSETP